MSNLLDKLSLFSVRKSGFTCLCPISSVLIRTSKIAKIFQSFGYQTEFTPLLSKGQDFSDN